MLLIVADSFTLSSQNATLEEKAARAEVWARVLFGLIPADRLQDSFDRAFAKHESSFPVNAYEIKAAWEEIHREEWITAKASEKENRKVYAVEFCDDKSKHANEHGEVEIADPFNLSQNILMPCPWCRPDAHQQARARHVEKNGGHELPPVEEVLGKAETFIRRPTHLTVAESTLEIIAKAKDDVGRELLRDPSNIEIQATHERLTRTWHYCYQNNL